MLSVRIFFCMYMLRETVSVDSIENKQKNIDLFVFINISYAVQK